MARNIEEPVTVERDGPGSREQVTTHPAYAQIRASRVSGNTALYDSDFRHNHYMTLSISRSELHRSLSRDWHFAREEIIEVAMTESQWATFVSSLNVGGGVPCTIQHIDRKPVPQLPDPVARTDQFTVEMRKSMQNVIDRVDALIAGAKTKAQKHELQMLRQQIMSNLPFVASQFEEHMETTVEAAKQEVHGYMTGLMHRAGLEALSGNLPLQIEHKEEG